MYTLPASDQRTGLALVTEAEGGRALHYYADNGQDPAGPVVLRVSPLEGPVVATLGHGPCGKLIAASLAGDATGAHVIIAPLHARGR